MSRKAKLGKADTALQEVLKRLKVQKERCVDVETSGLDWRRNHVVGYVVTFSPKPQDSYYVPFRHLGNANVGGQAGPTTPFNWDGKLAKGEKELVTALDQPGTMFFGHNIGFDLRFMFRTGYRFNAQNQDTIINEPLLNEWAGKFTLEACAQRYKVQAKKSQEIVDYLCKKFPEAAATPRTAMGHFWRLSGDDPMAVEYAAGDGTTTWQLRDQQALAIRDQDLGLVHDVESRLIRVLARMSTTGIKVDEERYAGLKKHIKRMIGDEHEKGELTQKFPENFNVRSPSDVRYWMEQHGHTDWPLTPIKRAPSFPENWLETYPAGKQIVEVRKLTTLRDTFVLPLQTTHMWNGRVHTNFNQLRGDEFGTVTGRLSSDGPNMQAVPKHNEVTGRLFRSIFVPDEGKIWSDVDYSQCEPRLLAYYSRCKVLMNGYMSDPPLDAHLAVAIACNEGRWDKMTVGEQKHYRNEYAKRINQTIITGGGKNVIVKKYKVPEDEIDKVWSDYHRAMPEIRSIQKRMERRMRERGYILTLLGRRCRLNDPDKAYVALNRALQGGNADVLKDKLVEVDDYLESEGRPLDVLLNCHDATAFQFDEASRQVYDECLRIMQDFSSPGARIKLDIPLTVDAGEGPDWAIATYGEAKQ